MFFHMHSAPFSSKCLIQKFLLSPLCLSLTSPIIRVTIQKNQFALKSFKISLLGKTHNNVEEGYRTNSKETWTSAQALPVRYRHRQVPQPCFLIWEIKEPDKISIIASFGF